MECFLWRHADALLGEDDLARPLSEKGKAQAQASAQWLLTQLPANARILVSPATRAQQTAAFLSREVSTVDELTPDYPAEKALAAVNLQDEVTLIVGHQPALSEMAIWLLNDLDALSWTATTASVCHIEWVKDEDSPTPIARLKALFYPE